MVNSLEENRLVAGLARMDKSIIRPLTEWGFVEVSKMGRSRWVALTEEGENAAKFMPGTPASWPQPAAESKASHYHKGR